MTQQYAKDVADLEVGDVVRYNAARTQDDPPIYQWLPVEWMSWDRDMGDYDLYAVGLRDKPVMWVDSGCVFIVRKEG